MGLKEKWNNRRRGSLIENTIMLYILQFSNMALGLLTQGYQMRVLGLERIGMLGAAQYATNFFQIVIDFGFIYSATAKISKNRHDKDYLSKILTCVVCAKLMFMVLSYAVLFIFIRPGLSDGEFLVYAIYLLSVCVAALLPDFMYRGLEQMSTITVRAVSIKLFATIMIFVFVRTQDDYWLVPLITAIGNAGALAFVYMHLTKKVGIKFTRVKFSEIWTELKESAQFFLSKVAGSVNSNLNGILLQAFCGPIATGLYTNADKVITAARSGMSPIADSLYPHMMQHRNFKIIKKAMLLIYPILLLGCAVVFIFAEPILVLWLGPEGSQVVAPLRMLIPVAVCAFPNYILGYPTLGAMGLSKFANISVVFGTAVYIIGIGIVWATVGIGLMSLCLLTTITEAFILAFRLTVIVKNRHLMTEQKGAEAK